MQDIEWMNEKAQEARRRYRAGGTRWDYTEFEYWQRAYLLAQAAMMWEKENREARLAGEGK